jgi:hypothetical protein
MRNLPENELALFSEKKNFFMLAAAILVIALMVPILYNKSANTELDSAALENYLSYQTNLSQYDLINSLEFEDINNINTTAVLEDKVIEDMLASNPDLEQLLNE